MSGQIVEIEFVVEPNYDGDQQYEVDDASLDTLVDLKDAGRGRPVGLALHDGLVFVSTVDPEQIVAFDLDGAVVDWLDLDRAAHGIEFAEDGSLYFAATKDDEVWRIQPAP